MLSSGLGGILAAHWGKLGLQEESQFPGGLPFLLKALPLNWWLEVPGVGGTAVPCGGEGCTHHLPEVLVPCRGGVMCPWCAPGPSGCHFAGWLMLTLLFLRSPAAQESHQEGPEVSGPGYCG